MLSSPLFAIDQLAVIGVVTVVVVMAFGIAIVSVFARYYKRCPSNRILVIYGKTATGQPVECIHGGARLVVPLVQDYQWLNLEPMQIEIPLRGALSIENIRVNVPSVFTVAIGTTWELMQNAAIRLLGLTSAEITRQAEDIIFGQLRQMIATMRIEDINRDRDKFLAQILKNLEPELRKIGLNLINVNITDITDESGYIEAMGERVVTAALLRKLLAAFDGSAQRLVAHLLEEGKLNEEDREEIRRLLDDSSSSS